MKKTHDNLESLNTEEHLPMYENGQKAGKMLKAVLGKCFHQSKGFNHVMSN